jgi:hypothetical protein
VRFAVSTVSPFGYPHSAAFAEVAEALNWGLAQLGHDSVLSPRLDNRRRTHVVLGANLLPKYPQPILPGSVLYNLEQIEPGSKWCGEAYIDLLHRHTVWDYSERNRGLLAELGVQARVVPVAPAPSWSRITPAAQDIDVLFYGSMNQRRHDVLEALRAHGLRVEQAFAVYGPARDALIARARIVLNLHYYQAKVFEIVRVAYLLANGVCVVSETGSDKEEEARFARGVAFAPYEGLVDTCRELLADAPRRAAIAARGRELASKLSLLPGLQAAVAALPAAGT